MSKPKSNKPHPKGKHSKKHKVAKNRMEAKLAAEISKSIGIRYERWLYDCFETVVPPVLFEKVSARYPYVPKSIKIELGEWCERSLCYIKREQGIATFFVGKTLVSTFNENFSSFASLQ